MTLQPRSVRNKKPAEGNGKGDASGRLLDAGDVRRVLQIPMSVSTHFKISHGVAQNKSK
jgi:hypothetical protein